MVQIIHGGENTERLSAILKAGRKRFSLYGFEKTTMKDIASDMGLSKGSLYYYFPDKESLYKAIVEDLQQAFIIEIEAKYKETDTALFRFQEYVKLRLAFFRSIMNMNQFRFDEFCGYKPMLQNLWSSFRLKEKEMIESILLFGVERDELDVADPPSVADLCLDVLKGIRNINVAYKDILSLSESEFETVVKKSLLFVEVFVKGLSKN
jgi:AcrR family transcriptional regulator